MACEFSSAGISVITYNMYGYNQGVNSIFDIIDTLNPDIFLLQEYWLTPANLVKFNVDFKMYYPFGSSAMNDAVAAGPLYGRPYGGLMTLVKSTFMPICSCIVATERYSITMLGDLLLINVYLPCSGSENI